MMKKIILFALLMLMPSISLANCYSINNSDSRNACLAETKHDASYCYSIRDNNEKNLCLAKVKGDKNYCYSITDNDLKNRRLAFVW